MGIESGFVPYAVGARCYHGTDGQCQRAAKFCPTDGRFLPAMWCNAYGPQLTDFSRQFKLYKRLCFRGDVPNKIPPVDLMLISSLAKPGQGPESTAHQLQEQQQFCARPGGPFLRSPRHRQDRRVGSEHLRRHLQYLVAHNTDIRFADQGTLFGKDIVYGATIDNNRRSRICGTRSRPGAIRSPIWGSPIRRSPRL